MKTILKITTIAMFMLATTVTFADDSSLELFTKNNSKDLIFRYETQNLQTKVKFGDGYTVFYSEEVFDTSVYLKKFNIKNLSDGNYFLTIENTLKKVTYNIHVTGSLVVIDDEIETPKPVIQKKNDLVVMTFLNKGKNKVKLTIYDIENDQVYYEEFTDKLIVEKAFDFTTIPNDNYRFVVKVADEIYSSVVSVK
ncbi:hypothetical protein MWU65_14360 [Cellulophaga sp. F20128]|uniref:hypothetical protein n=1 Tax=Cellulophaga sp. F20128 TaxID=2926413 RepID=UPI001FF36F1A|nr:hypothetical protein [Cellulophaga sp. F20128]MCK0158375.1 hypothetical protein [Cellulophaga sp. F20128]